MWFPGSRRLLYLSMVALLVTTVLQMWVFRQVGAIRVFPGNAVANVEFSHRIKGSKSKEDLFNKYFSGRRTFGLTPTNNTTQKGFDESKRRVPSCPDPLHN